MGLFVHVLIVGRVTLGRCTEVPQTVVEDGGEWRGQRLGICDCSRHVIHLTLGPWPVVVDIDPDNLSLGWYLAKPF